MATVPPFSTLARAVAQGTQPADVLPDMHLEVMTACQASASLLLHRPSRTGPFRATSGAGLDDLEGPWISAADAAVFERQAGGAPVRVDLASVPSLAARLGAARSLVVPLASGGEPAYLVVVAPRLAAGATLEIGVRAQVEFSLTLQLARLARRGALHRRWQELLLAFSRGISETLNFVDALQALAHEANALLGTRRTSIWLHDRRVHELQLSASSESGHVQTAVHTSADEAPARAMRLDEPALENDADGPVLLAPLRGWRRALGAIVIEGRPSELDDDDFAQAANDLARQLSAGIENVQLLDKILQQRRLLEDTFDSLIDLVVVTDNALRVVQMNDAFAERVSQSRPALLQRPLEELISAEMAQWVAESPALDEVRTARTRQFTGDPLGGVLAAILTPLIDQDGDPVGRVLVIRDITAQTALEREQAALRERLRQSERLASLGQFVAGIAHEINNPLQGVLGHLELLIATDDAAKPVRPTLKRIYREGDRAARIVRELLVFAGSRRLTREPVRLPRILARAIASRRAALRRAGISVVRLPSDRVPAVAGDPMQLQQAFLNIIMNAEQALAAGGSGGRIEVGVRMANPGTVRVTVRDTGKGIPPETLPLIFDPFFTTKEVGQGTGLGLAITYGIIQDHGGTLQAANAPGGGALFTVELPRNA